MSQTVKLRRSATSGSVPTTSALALGELAINTYDGKLYLKKSVSGTETIVEIGANNLADTFNIYEYAVTSNTTVFSGSDQNGTTLAYTTGSPPKVAVFLNGLLLDWGTDFTATNGTSVTLTSAAVSGDLVQIQAYKSEIYTGSNLTFPDNVKALFGDDSDLQIYHDSSHSYIRDVGTGNLHIDGTRVLLRSASSADMVKAIGAGAVELYHNAIKKFETTSTGATITGNLVATGDVLAADTNSATNPSITFSGHTTTGLSVYQSNSVDRLSIITGGAQRVNFGTHGVESFANVYTGNTSSFRNYGGTWTATTGLTGNGFSFINSVDGTALTLSATGNAVFSGTISSGAITSSGNLTTSGVITANGTSGSSFYGITLTRSSSGTTTPDLWGSSGTLVIGTSSSDEVLGMSGTAATFYGTLASGTFTSSGDVRADTHFNSTDTNATLSATGSGNVYLRPNGKSSTSGQVHIATSGNATFSGTISSGAITSTGDSSFGNITTTGYLRGPSTFTIDPAAHGDNTGTVVIAGNLTVNGSTTTLNTATLSVDDLNITVADGAANAAAANGAGLTVAGAGATLTYTSAQDEWNFNKNLVVGGKETTASFPLMAKSNTAHQAFHIEENSGAESWQMGVNVTGDLNFYNSGSVTPSITFEDSGEVGIGTSTPGFKLDVAGTARFTGDVYAENHIYTQRIRHNGDVDNYIGFGTDIQSFVTGNSTRAQFSNTLVRFNQEGLNQDFQVFGQNDDNLFYADASTDRIGIGTSSPDFTLDVNPSGGAYSAGDNIMGVFQSATDHQTALKIKNINTNTTASAPRAALDLDTADHEAGSGARLRAQFVLRATAASGSGGETSITVPKDLRFFVNNKGTLNDSSGEQASSPLVAGTEAMRITDAGNVGIGTISPTSKVHISGTSDGSGSGADAMLHVKQNGGWNGNEPWALYVEGYSYLNGFRINAGDGIRSLYKTTSGGSLGFATSDTAPITFTQSNSAEKMRIHSNGFVGIGNTSPKAKLQVEEYGIDTTETSTSATTQTVIHTMSASDFRSARFTIQVTNSTDSTYHTTEILMVHDDTNANITEFGKVYTANEEATFDADVSAGNVRLFATPATTDSMEFKVVCHSITV